MGDRINRKQAFTLAFFEQGKAGVKTGDAVRGSHGKRSIAERRGPENLAAQRAATTSNLVGSFAGRDRLVGIWPGYTRRGRGIFNSRHGRLRRFNFWLFFRLGRACLMQFVRKIVFGLLKFFQRLTHSAREFRQLLRAKEQQDQEENENPLRSLEDIQNARNETHIARLNIRPFVEVARQFNLTNASFLTLWKQVARIAVLALRVRHGLVLQEVLQPWLKRLRNTFVNFLFIVREIAR